MARVITFSTKFPAYHPKAGQSTYFVEKICNSFLMSGYSIYTDDTPIEFIKTLSKDFFNPKHHTIRAGNRWKVGDYFSPRIWSGKPYQSKQIIIAPDIKVEKTWDVMINHNDIALITKCDTSDELLAFYLPLNMFELIAKNDGLSLADLMDWFQKPFTGQIICWNKNIEY